MVLKRRMTASVVGLLLAAAAILPYWVFGQGGETPAGFPPPARTTAASTLAGVPMPGSRIRASRRSAHSSASSDFSSNRIRGGPAATPAMIRPKKSGRRRVRRSPRRKRARRRSKRRRGRSKSAKARKKKSANADAKSRFPAIRRRAARNSVELPVIPLSAMAPLHP